MESRLRREPSLRVEAYLERFPKLSDEQRIDLVYAEFLIRERSGEACSLEEYQRRFPRFAESLRDQIELHRALHASEVDSEAGTNPDALSPTTESSAESEGASDRPGDLQSVVPQAARQGVQAVLPKLPGYELLREIGRGGMGVVYLARHRQLQRHVAIKVLLAGGHAGSRHVQRFQTEASAVARLQHPGIVQIFEVGEAEGRPFLALEYLAFGSLAQWMRGQSVSLRQAAALVRQLATAVDHAHRQGIVHRDLKPSNVLLQPIEGEPTNDSPSKRIEPLPWTAKIADFGLAKVLDPATGDAHESAPTQTGDILGTPGYMSPEQIRGNPARIGKATDIYSLGAILYELLTGRTPFQGAMPLDVITQVLADEPIAPTRLVRRLPRDLEVIALKCLQKNVTDRYETAADLADDLERFLHGEPIRSRPTNRWERTIRWMRRRPAVAVLAAAMMLGVLAAGAGWKWMQRREQMAQLESLVESLSFADSQAVAFVVDRIAPQHRDAAPLLRRALRDSPPQSPAWLHAAIALQRCDGSQTAALLEYAPECRVDELLLIAQSLAPDADFVGTSLWSRFDSFAGLPNRRLRTAAILANLQPHDARWEPHGGELAELLIEQSTLELGQWTAAFRPVGAALVNGFSRLLKDDSRREAERDIAAQFAAEFAKDDAARLVEWLSDATPTRFHVFVNKLRERSNAAEILNRERPEWSRLDSWDESLVESDRDRLHRRRANLALAAFLIDGNPSVWQLLRAGADPTTRSYLIDWMVGAGVSAAQIRERFDREEHAAARQALLLALGNVPPRERSAFATTAVPWLLRLFKEERDIGVRSAAEWLLRTTFEANDALQQAVAEQGRTTVADDRSWFVNSVGQTYAVIRGPLEFVMGSPLNEPTREPDEVPHRRRIVRSFAIATKEVTVAEFLASREFGYDKVLSSTPRHPINATSWYDAAAYCRWLSEQEGIAEDQICFPPLKQIGSGMKLPENYLERTGYRLPTEAEWELACRAASRTSHSFGGAMELAERYAFNAESSRLSRFGIPMPHPVGMLKPNRWGLFDMFGNVAEWCATTHSDHPAVPADQVTDDALSTLLIEDQRHVDCRGESFGDVPIVQRSARRQAQFPNSRWGKIGFRPVRTLPPR